MQGGSKRESMAQIHGNQVSEQERDASEAAQHEQLQAAVQRCNHAHAHPSKSRTQSMAEPCFVAPHPDLLKTLIAKFNDLKSLADEELPILRKLLSLREPQLPLLNDGLLHAPDHGVDGPTLEPGAPLRANLKGPVNVVVVLVDFSDKLFSSAQTASHFQDLWFGTGSNSVNDFYRDASNNIVQITGQVVGPFRMPHPITYYANLNYGLGGAAPNARNLATDAANAAKGSVDFSKYDNDGDGTVETFVIVHAGAGAERTGNVNDIWSHKWAMSAYVVDDGVTLFPYLTVPADCKLGVCAHELGHLAFNWPDLYDSDYSSAGIGNWCLMAAGSYNGGESNPSPPSAWCKAQQGWVTVATVARTTNVALVDVKSSHRVLRINPAGAPASEYWLIENRHAVGRDANLPGDGLLVWHVDDALSNNNSEQTHYKVALLQADGRRDLERNEDRGDAGDQFPGVANVRAVNTTTTPSTKSYSSAATGAFALSGITDPAATINFTVTI